jgi:hypothetical protein
VGAPPAALARSVAPGGRERGAKAWRWVGETEEIARTFAAVGLPDGFHQAA